MTKINEITKNSDLIVSFGSFVTGNDNEINNSILKEVSSNTSELIYMSPMKNMSLESSYTQFIKYEVGSEEGIANMLLNTFVKNSTSKIQTYIQDLDIGYISAESSAGEEEFDELLERTENKNSKILLVGDDILSHLQVNNIIKILALIKKYSSFEVLALDEGLQVLIDTCLDDNIEEIQELKSYNGTLIYTYFNYTLSDSLIGSKSFAKLARIENNDEIIVLFNSKKIKKVFKLNENLQGTIALCALNNEEDPLFLGYRYKQVQIQKI